MKRFSDTECRRCGLTHDESFQMVDAAGRWAAALTVCECGHRWTVLYTAPANLRSLKDWLSRGCRPPEGPGSAISASPWRAYRLEGIYPASLPVAG